MRKKCLFLVALLSLVLPAALHAAETPAILTGTVVSSTATSVAISTDSGSKSISYGPKTRFFGIDRSSLDKVTAGAYIGTTVAPQPDGTYRSTEVHIFAASLRGTGEGFTKMDEQGHHMMANSTVRTVSKPTNMMANSTVRTVGSNPQGKTITLTFPSGTKTIIIPSNTPVYLIESGTQAMLVPGAHARVRVTQSGNGLVAKSLLVGEHGVIPPT